ncbi:LppX_LprAFG lipoprotein [Nocardia sp. NPDC059240]|uniref:LppX_LprAFG lipoprotein n=1 Tax=Nocardia sp. NPDC059240 TaxID=3346786 RepID=UPI0036A9566B
MRFRIASAVVALITAGALTGCADGSGGLPDAGLMMRDAAISAGAIGSAHLMLRAEGAVPGFPLRALEADVSKDAGGSATGAATLPSGSVTHFVATQGKVFSKSDKGTLVPMPAGFPSPSGMIGRDGGLAQLLRSLRDPETVGREQFSGVDAFKIEALVPAESLSSILPGTTEDATLTVWVRVRGAHLPLQTVLGFPQHPDAQLTVTVSKSQSAAVPGIKS